jgi:hypothetical protein
MKKYQLTIQDGAQGTRYSFVVKHEEEDHKGYRVIFTSDADYQRFRQRLKTLKGARLDYAGHTVTMSGKPERTSEGPSINLERIAANN